MHNLSDLRHITFPLFPAKEASLCVFPSPDLVPFGIRRIFTVHATEKCTRGFHAHKECTQLLVCLQGSCVVTVDEGKERKYITLNSPAQGLLIPPSLWAEQAYEEGSILMVMTDKAYDEGDYLRDYDDFLIFRAH